MNIANNKQTGFTGRGIIANTKAISQKYPEIGNDLTKLVSESYGSGELASTFDTLEMAGVKTFVDLNDDDAIVLRQTSGKKIITDIELKPSKAIAGKFDAISSNEDGEKNMFHPYASGRSIIGIALHNGINSILKRVDQAKNLLDFKTNN